MKLYIIDYQQISNFKNQIKLKCKRLKCVEQQFRLQEKKLSYYYDRSNITRENRVEMMLQRIHNSQAFLVMYPTGLLLHVSSLTPFTISSKTQLNLQNRNIIDYKYCTSTDCLNHCIWIIDQEYNVWKCYSERNLKESNWNLQKINILNRQSLNQFLQPAMTYDNYFMLFDLKGIHSLASLLKNDKQNKEYLFTFNQSDTKIIVVKQPKSVFKLEKIHDIVNVIFPQNKQIKGKLNQKLQIFVVGKHNQQIMNWIPKRNYNKNEDIENILQQRMQSFKQAKAFASLNDI